MVSRLHKPILGVAISIGLIAAGMLALLAVPGLRPCDVRAHQWRQQLDTMPDEQALARMRQIAALGDAGIPVLVEALGSRRESVARAARVVLTEEVDGWHDLRASVSSPKVALLARHLVGQLPRFGPVACRTASNLAARILQMSIDPETVDRGQFVTDCSRILRKTAAGRMPSDPHGEIDASHYRIGATDPPDDAGLRSASDLDSPSPGIDFDQIPDLPGGDLPIDLVQVPPLPPSGDRMHTLATQEGSGGVLPPKPYKSGSGIQPPRRFEPGLSRHLRSDRTERDGAARPGATGQHMDETQWFDPQRLGELDDLEVMRQLHAVDGPLVHAARDELIRRGFDEFHLALAERLTDPDPDVRRELTEALPKLQGIAPGIWLRALAHDSDPDVRLAAVTIMATGGDADMTRWLRGIELEETDPRIQRQLRRMLHGPWRR